MIFLVYFKHVFAPTTTTCGHLTVSYDGYTLTLSSVNVRNLRQEFVKAATLYFIPIVVVPMVFAYQLGNHSPYLMGLVLITAINAWLFRTIVTVLRIHVRKVLSERVDVLSDAERLVYALLIVWLGFAGALYYAKQNIECFSSGYHLIECLTTGFSNVAFLLCFRYHWMLVVYNKDNTWMECLYTLVFMLLCTVPLCILENVLAPEDIRDWLGWDM